MKMKAYVFLLALMPCIATANEPEQAPQEIYDEIVASCNTWAEEDEITPEQKSAYLAECINNELENYGYVAQSQSEN